MRKEYSYYILDERHLCHMRIDLTGEWTRGLIENGADEGKRKGKDAHRQKQEV